MNLIENNISFLYSQNPRERIPFLINVLNEYGINQNKNIYLQAFDVSGNYYLYRLVSLISKIDFNLIASYMHPTGGMSEWLKKSKIDRNTFIDALETLRNSNIIISSKKVFEDESYLNYVFALDCVNPYDAIIIDNFASFIEKTEEDLESIIKHIKKYVKKFNSEVIIFINEKDLKKYNFKGLNPININENIKFIYDNSNYEIIDIVND